MNEKRNVTLRDALLKALAVATFTAVSATAFTPVAQARVLLDEVNDDVCDLGDDDTGDGSAADPFRISTVEDLAEVGDCDYVDSDFYYSLENDLDISPDDNYNNDDVDWNTTDGGWEPIGEYHGESFNGEFDGNGHTISGLEIDNSVRDDDYVGLFFQTSDAVIKDLNIVGQIDAYDNYSIGMLAGGDWDSQISNVHVEADITDGDDYVGGLIGWSEGTRMSNITTTGDIVVGDDDNATGGIVGYIGSDDYEPSIIDSASDVNVNDANDSDNENSNVGGIAGDANYLRLIRVSFDGTVTGDEQVGGLTGSLYEGLIHDSVVTEDALVNVPSDEVYATEVGGLVGELDDSTISGSSFHGTLDAYLDGDQDIEDVGGIVGNADYSYLVNVYVGSTALLELAGGGDSSFYVGGIAGYADETAISGAAMNADLTVLNAIAVGGLVGGLEDAQLDSSVNRGNVSVTNDALSFLDDWAQVGGLVGIGYDGASVTNSTNKGDVALDTNQDTYGVGGIVGIGQEVLVTDNYNTGDVSGIYNIAGVVGMLTDQGAVVQRNYSVGTLTASDSNPDGIATLRGPDADPTDGPYINEPSNVVLLSDAAENETGAEEMTAVRLKTESELVALGWLVNDADRADWTIDADFNDGFPHLAWETVSEDIDEEIGLLDFTFQEIVTFLGGKRKMLRTYERNALNEVVDFVTVNAYDSVEVHVYYGTKVKLAQKRGLNVKRWLVRQGVAQPITVFVHSADNSNPIGSVTIEALVD